MLDQMRNNAQSWAIKALFAIIILAFIITFAAPRGQGRDSVARVYEDTIPVDRFLRSIPREAEDQPGMKQAVLYRMVNTMLLVRKAESLGLTPSDQVVAKAIAAMPEFQTDGHFDLARYKAALGNTPHDFEQSLKDDIATSRLQRFAMMPARPTEAEARAVFDWQNEFVTIDYLLLSPADFLDSVKMSDERLQEYYDAHKDAYKKPARITLKLVRFTPQALAVLQDVSDAEIAAYYEEMKGTLMSERTYRFRQVLIPVPENPSGPVLAELQAKALEVYKSLKGGADFDAAAAEWAKKGGQAAQDIEVPASVLPKALAQELQRLAPGQVGQPVPTPKGLAIPRLEAVTQPRPLTLDETHDQIRSQLAEEKAAGVIDDMLDKTIGQISQGKSLEDISKGLNLAVDQSEPRTRQDLKDDFGLSDEAVETLFALAPGTSTRTPLLIQGGGYLLAEKVEDLPEEVQPLDEIKARVTAEATMARARELAAGEAKDLLTALADPAADQDKALSLYKHLIVTSKAFGRSGPIPGLAVDPQLIQDAFAAPAGTWLPRAYGAAAGAVLARVNQRIPASEKLWEQQKEVWMQAAGQFNTTILVQGLAKNLFDTANAQHEIDVLRPDLLN